MFSHRGPLTQLIFSFPNGRLRGPHSVAAVAAGYLLAILAGGIPGPWIPALSAVLVAGGSVFRYLRASGHLRKAALPAMVAGLAFAAVLALSSADQLLGWNADLPIAVVYDVTVAGVLLGLTLAVRWGRWTDAAVADLVTHIDESDPSGVTRELRRALGDPGLIVGYWSISEAGYLDEVGTAIDPVARRGRVATKIDDGGQPIAILVHDATLTSDSTLIAGASAVLRIAASNAKMRADVEERVARLALARHRMVVAAEEQRAALEARVVSGPERHLAAAAEYLATLNGEDGDTVSVILVPVVEELAAARRELRQFVQGIRPGDLRTGGLAAALPALAVRTGLPVDVQVTADNIDPEVENAVYFLCSEALTNIAKHSGATVAIVRVAGGANTVIVRICDNGCGGADPDGSGLRGIADRVEALGGKFTIHTGPGHGTEILASVPTGVAP